MRYTKLIDCFLVAKKNNELLIKNLWARLIGATKFPEVNDINNHIGGRSGQGRNNMIVNVVKNNIFGPKNTHQKRVRNNE